jgi:hypothetical protein
MGDNSAVPTSLDDQTTTPEPTPAGADHPEPTPVAAAPLVPDAVCAAAVALAQAAATDVAGAGSVGDHTGLDAEGDRLVTHYFEALTKGYRGWRWAVTVARPPRSRTATVCEVVLLPGTGAVLAPTWLPWSDRLAPGDLGPADQLPYRADDPYLDFGYTSTDDEDSDEVALWELGLGRARVLSPEGRSAAAQRWYLGDRGPTSDEAVHAQAACASCGYFVALTGSLRQVFGVCANEWSPSDGRVVSVDHGCGAHSETDVEHIEPLPLPPPILDETGAEAIVIMPRDTAPALDDEAVPAGADEAAAVAVDEAAAVAVDEAAAVDLDEAAPVSVDEEAAPVTVENEAAAVETVDEAAVVDDEAAPVTVDEAAGERPEL